MWCFVRVLQLIIVIRHSVERHVVPLPLLLLLLLPQTHLLLLSLSCFCGAHDGATSSLKRLNRHPPNPFTAGSGSSS